MVVLGVHLTGLRAAQEAGEAVSGIDTGPGAPRGQDHPIAAGTERAKKAGEGSTGLAFLSHLLFRFLSWGRTPFPAPAFGRGTPGSSAFGLWDLQPATSRAVGPSPRGGACTVGFPGFTAFGPGQSRHPAFPGSHATSLLIPHLQAACGGTSPL